MLKGLKMGERVCKSFRLAEGEDSKTGIPCRDFISASHKGICGLCERDNMFLCIEDIRNKMPTLTQSAMKSFCQCPEKYKKRYVDGRRLKKQYLPDPMKIGLLWGAFMESENG